MFRRPFGVDDWLCWTWPFEEIEAIELALKNKGNLDNLRARVGPVTVQEGLSVGALWTVLEVARRLGIERALGNDRQGKLALWQVLARVLDQGSRLSAVRLARTHAACDALAFDQGFTEDDLYDNLSWLEASQASIENRLFRARWSDGATDLFFYDVTSSYLEGTDNALADWGYNRDKKKGKKQVVVGLLCDADGAPVSVEVFRGNTTDVQTFDLQAKKAAERFRCLRMTFGCWRRPACGCPRRSRAGGFAQSPAATYPHDEKANNDRLKRVAKALYRGGTSVAAKNPLRVIRTMKGRPRPVEVSALILDFAKVVWRARQDSNLRPSD